MKTLTIQILLSCILLLASTSVRAQEYTIGQVSPPPTLAQATYTVNGKPSDVISDPAKLRDMAKQMQDDEVAYVNTYTVTDHRALADLYELLGETAIFTKNYSDAVQFFLDVKRIKWKPADKMTACLADIAIAQTLENPGTDFSDTLKANLAAELKPLPISDVQDDLNQEVGKYKLLSLPMLKAQVADMADSTVSHNQINFQFAYAVVKDGYDAQFIVPNAATIVGAIQAALTGNVEEPQADIWTVSEANLSPAANLAPVIIGIWDSGTDTSLFPNNLYVNPKASSDGFGNDLHGAAWDDDDKIAGGDLYPIAESPAQVADLKKYVSGMSDQSEGVDSPASDSLDERIHAMPQDQITPFLNQLDNFMTYCHGTAVAGLAVAGNPAARIQVCRALDPDEGVVASPTASEAREEGKCMSDQITFMKTHGARIVNMSWSESFYGIETALASKSNDDVADIISNAQYIFNIAYSKLYNAMKSAPTILFVVAAGNDDAANDNHDYMPGDFHLPNMIDVGAVNQAGEETSFTTTNNVDVYADGYQVPCLIPGGDTVRMSGTSMAAPEVTNLAAKILASNPALTPAEVKKLILDHCDVNYEDGVTIKLINPKRTLAALGVD